MRTRRCSSLWSCVMDCGVRPRWDSRLIVTWDRRSGLRQIRTECQLNGSGDGCSATAACRQTAPGLSRRCASRLHEAMSSSAARSRSSAIAASSGASRGMARRPVAALRPARGPRHRQRRLHEPQLGHGPVAEIGVDALDDLARPYCDVERAGGIDAQDQRGAGPRLRRRPRHHRALRLARPFEPLGRGVAGHIRADDGGPVGQQRRGREAVLLEGLAREARERRSRPRARERSRSAAACRHSVTRLPRCHARWLAA